MKVIGLDERKLNLDCKLPNTDLLFLVTKPTRNPYLLRKAIWPKDYSEVLGDVDD